MLGLYVLIDTRRTVTTDVSVPIVHRTYVDHSQKARTIHVVAYFRERFKGQYIHGRVAVFPVHGNTEVPKRGV
jgi:hypothetical protein